MESFKSKTYSVSDFSEWFDRDQLILAPKFQRREVWTEKAKSYLLDTVIRTRPMPKLFIRETTTADTHRLVREVVDGQQRLRAILDFLKDGFKVSKSHNSEYGGKHYSDLPPEIKSRIKQYEISVDVLIGATDEDVLEVFARINSYAVTLNAQELLNAEFFGVFKQSAYELARQFYSFWIGNRIFTQKKVLRMDDARLVSELLIAMTNGIDTNKTIKSYYKEYDDSFPGHNNMLRRFRDTMDVIAQILPDLASSEFRRSHMFYSLFCSVYHLNHGIANLKSPTRRLLPPEYSKVRQSLNIIEEIFSKAEEDLKPNEIKFLNWARRATTDAAVRVSRSDYICRVMTRNLA